MKFINSLFLWALIISSYFFQDVFSQTLPLPAPSVPSSPSTLLKVIVKTSDDHRAKETEQCFVDLASDPKLPVMSINSRSNVYQLISGLKKISGMPQNLSGSLTLDQRDKIIDFIEKNRSGWPKGIHFIISSVESGLPVDIEYFSEKEIYINFLDDFKSGSYKKVNKSISYITGEVYALIEMKSNEKNPYTKTSIEQEEYFLKSFNGFLGFPSIKRIEREQLDNGQIQMRAWMPMYFADLHGFIYNPNQYISHNNLSDKKIEMMAFTLLKSLKLIHLEGFLHRDLKPENILVGIQKGHLSLILNDFGTTVSQKNRAQRLKRIFTHGYLSPVLSYHDQVVGFQDPALEFDEKDDLWAMGMLLYQLKHRKKPFWYRVDNDKEYQEQVKDLIEVEGQYELDPNLSLARPDTLDKVIKGLLHPLNDKRMTLDQAITMLEESVHGHPNTLPNNFLPYVKKDLLNEDVVISDNNTLAKVIKTYPKSDYLLISYQDDKKVTHYELVKLADVIPPLEMGTILKLGSENLKQESPVFIPALKTWGIIEEFFGNRFIKIKTFAGQTIFKELTSNHIRIPLEFIAVRPSKGSDVEMIFQPNEKVFYEEKNVECIIEKIIDQETILIRFFDKEKGHELFKSVPLSSLKKIIIPPSEVSKT